MELTSLLPIMRGRLVRHLSTLLLAAAFLLAAGGDVVGQSACPHHEAPQQAGTASAHGSGEHAGHHGPATDAESPGAERHGEHDTPCTCIGTCHVTATTPLPPLGAAVPAPAALLLETAIVPATDGIGVARILLRLLPFANGPPRLA